MNTSKLEMKTSLYTLQPLMFVIQDDVVVIVSERGIQLIPNWQYAAHMAYYREL
jgi:hypothetical protein